MNIPTKEPFERPNGGTMRAVALEPVGNAMQIAAEQDSVSEAEVIARAQSGDHDAFRWLVERYQARAFRLAFRVLKDEDQAKDAVQEAFLKVYGSIRRFEGRSSFYTWLYRIVFNFCLDLKRRDRTERHVEWDEGRALDVAIGRGVADGASQNMEATSAMVDLEREEVRMQVAEAISRLPEAQRETLLLREAEGLSYTEIAEVLGISKGTVMSRLHYARKKVQDILLVSGFNEFGEYDPEATASRAKTHS